MIPIPNAKPKASLTLVMETAKRQWGDAPLPETFVLAVRGYYSRTIGEPGNDLNCYDDALFIVSPAGFTSWNGNVDPTRYGWNAHAGKFMARLAVGCWRFRPLIHRGKYQAFGQGVNPVSVDRVKADGTVARTETGEFGINLHLGGSNGTSSEGCLTVPPPQWESFRKELNRVLGLVGLKTFDLILVNGPIN